MRKTTKKTAHKRASGTPTVAPQKALDAADVMSQEEIRALVPGSPDVRRGAPEHGSDAWRAAEAEIDEQLARGC